LASVSLPVSRPAGRALIVGSPPSRAASVSTLQRLGFQCAELDDPYTAMAELSRRPLVYRALILSLAGIYPEELILIKVIKTRLPHIEIWLTQTDGRMSALAEAQRMGAVGLLTEEGMFRTTAEGAPEQVAQVPPTHPIPPTPLPPAPAISIDPDPNSTEPILTADELRALLQEEPLLPPTDK